MSSSLGLEWLRDILGVPVRAWLEEGKTMLNGQQQPREWGTWTEYTSQRGQRGMKRHPSSRPSPAASSACSALMPGSRMSHTRTLWAKINTDLQVAFVRHFVTATGKVIRHPAPVLAKANADYTAPLCDPETGYTQSSIVHKVLIFLLFKFWTTSLISILSVNNPSFFKPKMNV